MFSIYDTKLGKMLRQWEYPCNIFDCKFSPDGTKLMIVHRDDTTTQIKNVFIWDTASGKELYQREMDTKGVGISFLDEKRIYTDYPTTQIWEIESGKELLKSEGSYSDSSLDGKRVLTYRDFATQAWVTQVVAQVWDVESERALCEVEWTGSGTGSSRLSPNGKNIYVSEDHWDEDHSYRDRIWNVDSGKEFQWEGNFVAFTPDGTKFVTVGSEFTHVYDAESAKELYKLDGSFHLFSSDEKKMIMVKGDDTTRIVEVDSGKELRNLEGTYRWFFPPHEKKMVTISKDHTIRIWDWEEILQP